jgi:hypothetical protein
MRALGDGYIDNATSHNKYAHHSTLSRAR